MSCGTIGSSVHVRHSNVVKRPHRDLVSQTLDEGYRWITSRMILNVYVCYAYSKSTKHHLSYKRGSRQLKLPTIELGLTFLYRLKKFCFSSLYSGLWFFLLRNNLFKNNCWCYYYRWYCIKNIQRFGKL